MSCCVLTDREVSLTATLRQWMEGESWGEISALQNLGGGEAEHKQIILCKTAIAYGIAALLRQAARSHHNSALSQASLDGKCSIDNFAVRYKAPSPRSIPAWKDIDGVDMLSPRLSVNIIEPSFLQGESDGGDQDDEMGRYLEVEFASVPETDEEAVFVNQSEENDRCHSFGVLLYELFLNCPPIYAEDDSNSEGRSEFDSSLEHVRKKIQVVDLRVVGNAEIRRTSVRREKSYPALPREGFAHLSEGGLPSNLSLLIHNLLDCGEDDHPENAYESLDSVINDLHLLLLDPSRFLFNNKTPTHDNDGRMKLSFRQHQIYGRENEVVLITEAFCRVSGGKSESLFIGGFSGSGKSRLVNGLTARVDVAGGYVLTHKFEQMSQEKSILDIVTMFNDLCLLIRDKNSRQDLQLLVNDLVQCFCSDLFLLSRILPNVILLIPQLGQPADDDVEMCNEMNARSICFTLQRFIRVVSSPTHPVVLFFDDLQWCDESVLNMVESLLCDAIGTACLFFVGTYRSNEVADDHEILCLAKRLNSCGVPTTMLSLEGLTPKPLNTMVSDALCIFPRITEPLSDIINQKTKGNPFFVLSFMRSLVDRGLLEYNINMRRWVWDEDDVSLMDVTGNVLYLLSSKMSELSSGIQSALKVAGCFGNKMKGSLVETLSSHPEYSDIRDTLDQVVKEGFMVEYGTSEFKFVHDKVREAAYSLIPKEDKDQFHYRLGMSLYSITKGRVADYLIFCIADQIKHGIVNLADESTELQVDIAEFFELSGSKAVASSDHTASCSYLTSALSLLPSDHWKSHYDLSLRINLCLGKSLYSCGNIEKAQCILQDMISQCHSIEDKLPAHSLLAKNGLDQNSFIGVYTLCREVLSQLGEEIPESVYPFQNPLLIIRTLNMVKHLSEGDLLGMKKMDEKLSITMKFYNTILEASYKAKPNLMMFFTCKMVQLTMKNGLCKHSIFAFIKFAAVLCNNKFAKAGGSIALGSRIGKAVLSCSTKRFHTSEQLSNLNLVYYTNIAFYTEPFQTCADMFRQGFDASMSLGETGTAFLHSNQHIRTALIAGERLPALLGRIDYYLNMANTYQNEVAKATLALHRETISALIDKGGSISSTPPSVDVSVDMESRFMLAGIHYHRATQAYWQGHSERCQYFIGKFATLKTFDRMRQLSMMFIEGMNSFQMLKRTSKHGHNLSSQATVLKAISNAILALKASALLSSWNFQNKVNLLEAEQFSLQNKNGDAQASYVAAIHCARSSGFIHEQGLACERAGYHCRKINDLRSAWTFFDRAKQCYTEWGSKMKVDSITLQLESLSEFMPGGASSWDWK